MWCSNMRVSYKHTQEAKTPQNALSQDQIGRPEVLGFEWSRNTKTNKLYSRSGWQTLLHTEQSMETAMLPKLAQTNTNIGVNGAVVWGSFTRRYKKVRLHKVHYRRIRLVDLQYWALNGAGILIRNTNTVFQEWLVKLDVYKAKYGHCNDPETSSSEYISLGRWWSNMRVSYKITREVKTQQSF